MAVNLEEVVTTLSGLTVLEASELVKKLEDKWGVSAAAPVAVAAAGGAAAGGAGLALHSNTSTGPLRPSRISSPSSRRRH